MARYKYDSLNRLVREDNKPMNKTVLFTYDTAGNITERCEYAYTSKYGEELSELECTHHTYEYDGDRLMRYDDKPCMYDANGNMLAYCGRTATFDAMGRLQKYGETRIVYNGDGTRESKEYLTFTYDSNGRLIKQSDGLEFIYDNSGVIGLKYSGNTYFYRRDCQGNIIALIDNNGAVVVEYKYDAWGNHEAEVASEEYVTLANLNPFRYRGYYYDSETGLYYLQSRYYDPTIGRFISPDSVDYLDPESINGLNLYIYCLNNPVMYIDQFGTSWASFWNSVGSWLKSNWEKVVSVVEIIAGAVALFIPGGQAVGSVLLSMGVTSMMSGYANELSGGAFLSGWVGGQISGLFAAIPGLGPVASAVMGFTGGFVGSVTTEIMDNALYNRGLSIPTIFISSLVVGFINSIFTVAAPKPVFGIKYGNKSFIPAIFGYLYYTSLVWGTRGFLTGTLGGFFPDIG